MPVFACIAHGEKGGVTSRGGSANPGGLSVNARSALHSCLFLAVLVLAGGCGGDGGGNGGGGGDTPPPPPLSPPSPQPNASPTNGFNQAGGFNGPVRTMSPVSAGSGDVYVSGDFTAYANQPVPRVVRVRSDGTLHEGFRLADLVGGQITSVALADDGSGALYVAEQVAGFPVSTGRLWKIQSNGNVDPTFVVGTATLDDEWQRPFAEAVIRSLVPVGDGSGRVYAAVSGLYNGATVGAVVRVNPDGSLDSTFNSEAEGVFRIVPAQDGSGDLYTASWLRHMPSGFASNLSRLNADGTWDPAFQPPGHWPHVLYYEVSVNLMVPIGDGSRDLFAVGVFLNFDAPQPIAGAFRGLVRIKPDGTVDLTAPRPQVDPTGTVVALVQANDGSGDWFVGQTVVQTQSTVRRYRPDGTINADFTTGQLVGTDLRYRQWAVPPYLVLPAPDGSGDVYVGGEFSSYNGLAVNNIVRVKRDGSL